jgi:NADH-quinone oxidoreductase subunit N
VDNVPGLLAAMTGFKAPYLDYHALAPDIILTGVVVLILLADLVVDEQRKVLVTNLAGVGVLVSLIPIITLAVDGTDRTMFGGAYVVDDFALVMKALFLVSGYVVLLMSTNYVAEGDYYEGEFSFLLLSSLLGMTVMASARDHEAALKYYLLGVLASAVMLYGMSLVFGATGTTVLDGIREGLGTADPDALVTIGIFFIIVGFAFKISAVPFHFWAPDTYEGAPTPVTAFLSVASKTAGFVALFQLVFVGFLGQEEVWGPLFWVLAALSMTVGNLIALRQTNVVRMLAYSSIAQAGYMLVPFAVAGENAEALQSAQTATIVYLLIYAAMNLGAFAVVIAVARKTRSGEISSYGGLFSYAPGLTVLMSIFLFALAGIPPLGGWFAKLYIFRAAIDAGTPASIVLAVIAVVNSVIALFYYAGIAREMWMNPVPDDDKRPVSVPPALATALGLTALVVVAIGVYPNAFARLGDLASLTR